MGYLEDEQLMNVPPQEKDTSLVQRNARNASLSVGAAARRCTTRASHARCRGDTRQVRRHGRQGSAATAEDDVSQALSP